MPQAQQDHRVRPASRLASAVRHAKEEQVILKGNPIRTLARILAVISAGAALILLMPAVWLFIAFNNEYRVCVPLENGMNLGYEAVFDLSRPLFKPIAVPRFPDGTPLIRVETWALYVTDTTIYGLTDDRRKIEEDYLFAWRADRGLVRPQDDRATYKALIAEAGHANWDIGTGSYGTGFLLKELLRRRAPDRPRCPTALLTW